MNLLYVLYCSHLFTAVNVTYLLCLCLKGSDVVELHCSVAEVTLQCRRSYIVLHCSVGEVALHCIGL